MRKLARRKLFKLSAVEGGDKTFLTIPLFDYNILLNTKQSIKHLFISTSIGTSICSDKQQAERNKFVFTTSFRKANCGTGFRALW
jgi:hypothetical protein